MPHILTFEKQKVKEHHYLFRVYIFTKLHSKIALYTFAELLPINISSQSFNETKLTVELV